MQIQKLTVQRFGPLENLKIEFYTPNYPYFKKLNINLIVGENGVGKTSLLRLVAKIFSGRLNKKSDVNLIYKIDGKNIITIDNHTKLKSINLLPSCVIVSSYSVKESFDVVDLYKNGIPYYYIGPAETVISDKKSIQINSINRKVLHRILISFYGKERYHNAKMAAVKYLMNFINYQGLPTIEVNESIFENSLNYEQQFVNFVSVLKPFLFNKNKIRPKSITHNLLVNLLKFDRKYNIIKDIHFMKNGISVSLSSMSSGELTMFNRFFPLITLMKDDAVVLIDEPETHLHPRWIREYIYTLYKMFADYNAHIILASHSPMIVSDVPKECVVGLIKREQVVMQYNIEDNTFGGEPSDILEDVFHLRDYKGKFTEEMKNFIKQTLLDKDKLDQYELVMKIFRDLSPSIDKYELMAEIKRNKQ